MGVNLQDGNIDRMGEVRVGINPASVSANTTAEQTFTVVGLTTDDQVIVSKPTLTAGFGIVNARVSAANTLAITFINCTASPIDAPLENYTITWFRNYPGAPLPSSVQV